MYVITDELYRELEVQYSNWRFDYDGNENPKPFPVPVFEKSFFNEARHIDIKDFEELKKKLDDSGYDEGVKDGAKYGYQ